MTPVLGEELECRRETDSDLYAVAVLKTAAIVGHLEEFQPPVLSFFTVMDGSSIRCAITGSRRYSTDLPQGGLSVSKHSLQQALHVFISRDWIQDWILLLW